MRVLGLRLLVSAGLCGLICAGASLAQKSRPSESATQKLDRYVRDACGKHPLIRPQAAKRIAKAGEAGLAAVQRYLKKNGQAQISADLVEALGGIDVPGTKVLLRSFLKQDQFPWPPQAMRAFSRLAKAEDLGYLKTWLTHPAHVMRAGAILGMGRHYEIAATDTLRATTEPHLLAALKDKHPFVRVEAASWLLRGKNETGLRELALGTSLQGRWFRADLGTRTRKNAKKALKTWGGNYPK